ncbi:PE-PPE domain-containing protein [Mycobacterium sp. ITM-2016-00318]|uniref:PE-PPE domain-containing protein n=1 Tax=Mycobacterium sp. ITM-2016-00318 TaxID=2099693 RepID=UPI00287F95C6|nr:PE-PPE domain-containing protein [Mycobacterium sp. ITM-2016-00318]WNG95281.1 PE-PPE domain-containing protein [Mycobacterium sp. ITM-2016-00318]
MTVSIGVAALVVAATTPSASADAPPAGSPCPGNTTDCLYVPPPDRTALVLGGTTVPTPDQAYIDAVRDHFIAPTHPRQDIDYIPVTAPMEFWPITGFSRLVWFVIGPQSVWGLNGPGWPDEPLWKLSGLFDRTFGGSVRGGVTNLEDAIAAHPNEGLVIYGYSQGAVVANIEKQKLAEQYPERTDAPDIDFVLSGDPNLPNGGIASRFPGLYIPILDVSLNGPAQTDTQFDTVEILRQYDGASDFPLYPLNLVSTANALLGALYVHPYDLEPSLADPGTPSPIHTKTGDTDYYFFETEDLPLFAPLRMIGVPEPLIDVVEQFFRVLVELGYDRSILPGEPTPARLIPPLNPVKVATDLVNAVGEGTNNALAIVGLPSLLSIPAPVTLAAPATETATADIFRQVTSKDTPTQTEQGTVDGNGDQTQLVTVDGNGDRNPAGDVDRHGNRTHQVTSVDTPTRIQHVPSASAGASASSTTATPEPSASASTPKPAKRAGQPAKTRPGVRDSLGVTEQLPDRSHRSEGERPTTRTGAAGAGAATGARSSAASSSAASSSTGSSSLGASGGDGHGS